MGLLLLRDDALEKMQDFMFPSVAKSKGRLMTSTSGAGAAVGGAPTSSLMMQASSSKFGKKNL